MSGTTGPETVDALLDQAEVLADTYDEGDVAALRDRLLHAPAPPRRMPDGGPAGDVPAPRFPTECEQAAHDLDLAVSLVVGAPEAAGMLARLVDDERSIAPEGALVFACLLHLAGCAQAAQFWWQFAAGGGSRTAAFCLSLHHRRHGEFRDAEHWRAQGARLTPQASRECAVPPAARGGRAPAALLPARVRHTLLSQCHRGYRASLPGALEAVIRRLPGADGDEDFPGVPRVAHDLPHHLLAR